ncbi:MAG: nucleotide-binding protein [Methanomicrobiales archaeon]|nr:nucleotide-binding protein [Methanomicrobiales archaeon]MDD1660391.1 nucleotide-binding protein [Methanomicrobiales archaeon]
MRVVVDTNAFLLPGQFGIDLFSELERLFGACEVRTVREVATELEGIARGRGRDAAAARLGLTLLSRCTVEEAGPGRPSADARLADVAARDGSIVVTSDRGLRDSLLARGIAVVSMRGRKRLELIRG